MKFLLTSAGNTNRSIEKSLLALLGKPFSESSLVFIPTAANVEPGDKSWLVDDMYNFRKLNFKSLDVIDIAAVEKNIWLSAFEKADVLLFGGGNTYYLLEQMRNSGVADALPELLKDKVYVGISAGSMVVTPDILIQASTMIYEEHADEHGDGKGLGLVPFYLLPHLNSPWFSKVRLENAEPLANKLPGEMYVIDDQTAIQVTDGHTEVVSEGMWKKFN